MDIKRKKTREIKVGSLKIGGNNPIIVQSMTKSKLHQAGAIEEEIKLLIQGGCEVIRVAVPDNDSLSYLKSLKKKNVFRVPLVADIQFDYKLALGSLELGVDCIRINPGNIGGRERLSMVLKEAARKGAAIRVGVNSGSLKKGLLEKNNGNMAEAMVESVLESVRFFENHGFYNFKISAKASSVLDTIEVYEKISEKLDYPLHLGVTEAGPLLGGSIKSSLGLGILLSEGIGDTIRVSLTDSSIQEVRAAYLILNNLGLRNYGVDIISCPTCGRTRVDLQDIVRQVEDITRGIKLPIKIAVMGCVVNGPGEARDADLGIAFGKEKAAIFIKGTIKKRVPEKKVLKEFEQELQLLLDR